MDPHHPEPVQEDFKMDYSEWHPINFIPAVIFFGFLIGVATIFI
ncbi:hypothetical protein [Desulfallas sp. Bu1-1]|jgi:hypothetical protein|nr:hypothetical protein [Desulfallas sp. Bu1-1]